MLLRAGIIGKFRAYLGHKQAFQTTVIVVLVWRILITTGFLVHAQRWA